MMREILYRGKRLDNGYDWVEGGILQTEDGFIIVQLDDKGKLTAYDVVPETVGQYTGLTDRNGKKIFEGDLHEYNRLWIIKYGSFCDASILESCYGWYIVEEEGYCIRLRDDESKYMNIIGNIHDKEENE